MSSLISISAQSSFSLNGLNSLVNESFCSLNAFEFNTANYSAIKDWGFSVTYGGEIETELSSNLYQISAAKNFGNHFIMIRYSPGYQKDFIFRSTPSKGDSLTEPISVEDKYSYKELFGFGYSHRFSENLTAGINVRYFEQDITRENITIIYSTEPYFDKVSEFDNSAFWKTDLGLLWHPNDAIYLNLATSDLILLKKDFNNSENKDFELRTKKSVVTSATFSPGNDFGLNITYETTNSVSAAVTKLFNLSSGKLGFSITGFHDAAQEPFITGVLPAAVFISKYFDVALSYVKYFNPRDGKGDYQKFKSNGISNIINNQYSFDKILLTTNFKLNTIVEQKVKFLDVMINQNIYPALTEKYFDSPIATAKIINLTNERLTIKPEIKINGLNDEKIQSPVTTIEPYDTTNVDFYSVIPENYDHINPELTYADFYIMTSGEDYDDQYQKAVLVNGINAWDGNVFNLKYFIKKDLGFSLRYAKSILAANKNYLDSIPYALVNFYTAKLLFDNLVKNLTYIADPRASEEFVQYPSQTVELKGGDCDDISVCFSSLLESVGIETALVDYNNDKNIKHVNIMFNTKLIPEQGYLITNNDLKYFIRKNDDGQDEIWLPVETTTLTEFNSAWQIASDKFQEDAINKLGLIKGTVSIIDINQGL